MDQPKKCEFCDYGNYYDEYDEYDEETYHNFQFQYFDVLDHYTYNSVSTKNLCLCGDCYQKYHVYQDKQYFKIDSPIIILENFFFKLIETKDEKYRYFYYYSQKIDILDLYRGYDSKNNCFDNDISSIKPEFSYYYKITPEIGDFIKQYYENRTLIEKFNFTDLIVETYYVKGEYKHIMPSGIGNSYITRYYVISSLKFNDQNGQENQFEYCRKCIQERGLISYYLFNKRCSVCSGDNTVINFDDKKEKYTLSPHDSERYTSEMMIYKGTGVRCSGAFTQICNNGRLDIHLQ